MTLQQLIYFKEVARTLRFAKAADALFVTPSTLSYAISSLESELGVPLFLRENGKSVKLTSFGDALLPMVDKSIDSFKDIEAKMHELRNPMGGNIRVAYSYINGGRFVPKMFYSFNQDNPSSEINLDFQINHMNHHFEQEVALGELDLAFSCTPSTEGLITVPFAQQELYLLIPRNHPLAVKDTVRVEDIQKEVFIGYDKGRNLDARMKQIFRSSGFEPNIDSYAVDWVEQLSLIALGKGLGILPMLPFDNELVKALHIDHPMHVRTIYMMWAANRDLPPAAEYVRDYCLKYAKTLGTV